MPPKKHATLSASSAHRWLNCPPSALQEARLPDHETAAAREGSLAHALAEYLLRTKLGLKPGNPPPETETGPEMVEHAQAYAEYVAAAAKELENPLVSIEQRLDYSPWVEDGFGTGDTVIISDGTLHIIDLKYGQGVRVEAENNPQLGLYALGAYHAFNLLYNIETVKATIYQPRMRNIATWETSPGELLAWAADTVKPAAALAIQGKGEYRAGEWCRFCKLGATCRARAEENLALARHEFRPAAELSDMEITEILGQLPKLTAWAGALQKYALAAALNQGKRWEGQKLVAGRANRQYQNIQEAAAAAQKAGYTDIWDRRLLGITAMERLMGRKQFTEILGPHITRPPGKPLLVPETDPRPPILTDGPETDFQPI